MNTIKSKRYIGRYITILNTFVVSMFFFVTRISNTIKINEKVYYRNLINIIILFFILKIKKIDIIPSDNKQLKIYLIRGFFSGLMNLLMFASIYFNSLQTFSVLFSTRLFFIQILSTIFLKEKFHSKKVILAILSFFGIVLVIFPDFIISLINGNNKNNFNKLKFFYSFIPLLCSLVDSTNQIFWKKYISYFDPYLNNFYFSIFGIMMSSIFLSNEIRIFFSFIEYLEILLISLIGFIIQYLFVIAAKYEKPSINSIIFNFNIAISFFLDILIIGSKLEYFSLLGSIFIITSSILFLI